MNNSVELIGHYGGDISHAQSAWTSTSRELTQEKIDRVPKLLKMLASNGHLTPFEKSSLHFLVNTDVSVHVQTLKHRVACSVNAECLSGDTIITFVNNNNSTGNKYKKRIDDLYHSWNYGRPHQESIKDAAYQQRRIKNMRIRVLNEDSGLFEHAHIKDIWISGEKDIYKITLENGKQIKCSSHHPLYTDNGYSAIDDGLNVGDVVLCNGVSINIPNRPWTFIEFFNGSEQYTRVEFAKLKGLKYQLVKKWGYIFDIVFKFDTNQSFKKGNVPWNDNKKGTYHINIGDRQHNPLKGDKSHFWRGGITSERAMIGVWTTKIAYKIHQKYNFTCQCCGTSGGELHAHHIIPVAQDISKAYDESNLITVCGTCHSTIHKSLESEQNFANMVLGDDFVPFEYNKRIGINKKSCSYVTKSKIVAIEYIGKEKCYDIEIDGPYHNFVANGIVTHNSARYKELKEDKYYIPHDWPEEWQEKLGEYTESGNKLYHECLADLEPLLGRARAKESARFFKTYNSQITADVMFNFSSFAHFLSLRNKPEAQLEIREVAQQMLQLVKDIEGNPFEHTLAAFNL